MASFSIASSVLPKSDRIGPHVCLQLLFRAKPRTLSGAVGRSASGNRVVVALATRASVSPFRPNRVAWFIDLMGARSHAPRLNLHYMASVPPTVPIQPIITLGGADWRVLWVRLSAN